MAPVLGKSLGSLIEVHDNVQTQGGWFAADPYGASDPDITKRSDDDDSVALHDLKIDAVVTVAFKLKR